MLIAKGIPILFSFSPITSQVTVPGKEHLALILDVRAGPVATSTLLLDRSPEAAGSSDPAVS